MYMSVLFQISFNRAYKWNHSLSLAGFPLGLKNVSHSLSFAGFPIGLKNVSHSLSLARFPVGLKNVLVLMHHDVMQCVMVVNHDDVMQCVMVVNHDEVMQCVMVVNHDIMQCVMMMNCDEAVQCVQHVWQWVRYLLVTVWWIVFCPLKNFAATGINHSIFATLFGRLETKRLPVSIAGKLVQEK